VKAGGVFGELEWWRAYRTLTDRDDAAMRDLLERLKAWKAQHDQDRARQLGFLRMAWDAVFGDEDEQVAEAIRQLEDALHLAECRRT
jgi:cytidylate kinase